MGESREGGRGGGNAADQTSRWDALRPYLTGEVKTDELRIVEVGDDRYQVAALVRGEAEPRVFYVEAAQEAPQTGEVSPSGGVSGEREAEDA